MNLGKKLSNSEFIERAAQSNPTVRPLDPYINGQTNMRFECMQCGNIWSARPSKILYRGHGCPVCVHIKAWDGRRVTESQFVERLNAKHPLLTLISGYVGTQDKAKFYCRNCAQEFEASPNAVLHMTGCPICAASDAEQRITQYFIFSPSNMYDLTSYDSLW
jgi:Zn finger protein HypA/HybF involved in hydrogenase expression